MQRWKVLGGIKAGWGASEGVEVPGIDILFRNSTADGSLTIHYD